MTRDRRFFLVALAVCLLVAGGVSLYASSHPDGLEQVAEQTGFAGTAEESPAAGSPMADYTTRGVEDARLSTGVAGVVGSLLVLAVAGGLFLLLRRRRGTSVDAATGATGAAPDPGAGDVAGRNGP